MPCAWRPTPPFVRLRHGRLYDLLPVGRQVVGGDATLEFERVFRMRLLVGREARVPRGFGRLAPRARIPGGVDRLGDFEGRMAPTDVLARRGDFLFAQRGAVRGLGAGLAGRALADHRLAADERGQRNLRARGLDRTRDGGRIVAVDPRHHVPPVCLEALRRVVAEPAPHFAVDRYPVVVVEGDQLAEPEDAGERAGLV